MMPIYTRCTPPLLASIALLGLLAGACDRDEASPASEPAAPPPQPASTVETTADEPLQVEGTLTTTTGRELQFKQAFDAAHIRDLAVCDGRLFAVANGGRVVEWDTKTLTPKQTLDAYGAVTTLDASDGILFAGTADGRLIRSTCDGRDPVTSPEPSWPVRSVRLDVRSKKRGFVVYEVPPTKANKLEGPAVSVALVDLETGRATREPFQRPVADRAVTFGFVDYRGELWFGLTPPSGRSSIWFMERFDAAQPPLAGLGDDDVIRGLIQMSREVWGYGGSKDGTRGLIYRVDTNRAVPMWDGEKAWFGERPGGDLPEHPIVAMHKRGRGLVVASTHAVYSVDAELRRWKRLLANDPIDGVLRTASTPVVAGERIFVGTHDGLVAIDENGWRRATVQQFRPLATGDEVATELTWRGRVWTATNRGLQSRTLGGKKATNFRSGPRRNVTGLFADTSDRLWVFADDGVWLFDGIARGQQQRWDATKVGLAPDHVVTAAPGGTPDSIAVTTSYDAEYRLRVTPRD